MVDDDGLRVLSAARARRAVAHMTDRHVAFAQLFERLVREDVVDEAHVFVGLEDAVVVDDDARRLLPAVLQGKERIVCGRGDRLLFGGKDAEHAALFVNVSRHITPPSGA